MDTLLKPQSIIKLLSPGTINRIAAGEVIEHPAAVVKELTENAIDAGASEISIHIEAGGRNLISIRDNGRGMNAQELELSVERHATSKLSDETLVNITSLGFRGEALPSIGAVARLQIISRTKDSDEAYEICVEGGLKHPVKPAAMPSYGTKVVVRDLFFATPARLKFLKSEKSETDTITKVIKKLALAYSHISFDYYIEGKRVLNLTSADFTNRITQILGEEFYKNALEVNYQFACGEFTGLISLPTYNKRHATDQFFLVNHRPVQDKLLSTSLRVAYLDYMPRERHAVAVLALTINPDLIDVNVHPAKTEIRYQDENTLRSALHKALKQALSQASFYASTENTSSLVASFKPEFQPDTKSAYRAPDTIMKAYQPLISEPSLTTPSTIQDSSPSRWNYAPSTDTRPTAHSATVLPPSPVANRAPSPGSIPEPSNHPLGVAKAQILQTYIVAQNEKGLIIVDQHAAHERIIYERMKLALHSSPMASQRLLMPEIVELSSAEIELLEKYQPELAQFGLTIEINTATNKAIVIALPAIISNSNPADLVKDLVADLAEYGVGSNIIEMIEHVSETMACHASIRAGQNLSSAEMNRLLRDIESTPHSGQCNHGRPTYIELPQAEIEKLFGRR